MLGLLEQFGVARLLEGVVELVSTGYPLSVIQGLVHSLPCSSVTQICRKTVRTWFSLCGSRMVLLDPEQKSQPRRERAHRHRSGGRRGVLEAQSGRALLGPPALLGEDVEEECGRVRAARKFSEKFDPQYQQLKEEAKRRERTVELQEQAEVFAQVMKEPWFSSCPPWVLNPFLSTWRRGNLLVKLNIDRVERNCCIRSPFVEVE